VLPAGSTVRPFLVDYAPRGTRVDLSITKHLLNY